MLKECLKEDLMIEFEEEKDVLSYSCKFDHISSLLFMLCDVFEGAGDYFNAIHDVVCELSKHNKDINIYCKKEGYHASIIIVFFRNGNYTKDFLGLILKLKDKLLLYEDIKVVKILPI